MCVTALDEHNWGGGVIFFIFSGGGQVKVPLNIS